MSVLIWGNCQRLASLRFTLTTLSTFKSRECLGGSTRRSGDITAVDTQWLDTMKTLLDKLAAIVELATANRPLCRHEVLLLKQRYIDFGQWFPGKVARDLTYKGHRVAKHLWQYAEYWGRRGHSPGLRAIWRGNPPSREGGSRWLEKKEEVRTVERYIHASATCHSRWEGMRKGETAKNIMKTTMFLWRGFFSHLPNLAWSWSSAHTGSTTF